MGSRKNNRKTVIRKKKPQEQITEKLEKKKLDIQKIPLLKQKDVSFITDYIQQGINKSSRGLNIGKIEKKHKMKIYLLFEELRTDPRNQRALARTNKLDLEIADVLIDYIKARNKPINEILNELSKKEIDIINKLIFKKLFFD